MQLSKIPVYLTILTLSLTACGPHQASSSQNEARERETTGSSKVQETAVPITGGTATSKDGIFSIEVAPNILSQTVTMRIEESEETPSADATFTKLYTVTYKPEEAEINGSVWVQFAIEGTYIADIGADQAVIAFRQGDESEYTGFLDTSYQDHTGLLRAQIDYVASFAAVNAANLTECICDDSDECTELCICDTDCSGEDGGETGDPDVDPTDPIEPCADGQFQCTNGVCIEEARVCDTLPDCMDGSDEMNCGGGGDGGGGTDPGSTVAPDEFEPDNTSTEASTISDGETQTRSIPAGDEDWVTFTIDAYLDVNIETSGAYGDTKLYLFSEALSQLAYDDDGGTGTFSKISTQLQAGTYIVKASGYSTSTEISSYTLSMQTSVPLDPAPEGVAVTVEGQDLVVTWSAAQTALSYNVYYDESPGEPYDANPPATEGGSPISTTSTMQRLSGLQEGQIYYIAIRGVNEEGLESYFSQEVSMQVPLTADEFEPDNDFANASTIAAGETQNRSIHTADDLDFVSFEVTRLSNVVITTSGPTGDGQLYLYNSNQEQIAYDDDDGDGMFSRIDLSDLPDGLEPGTYYAKAQSFYSYYTLASYTLSLTVEEIIIPDGPPDEHEEDNTVEEATVLEAGTAQTHSIHRQEDLDFFKFTLDVRADITLETRGTVGDTLLEIFTIAEDGTQTQVAANDDNDGSTFARIEHTNLAAGMYYARVQSKEESGQVETYVIELTAYEYPDIPGNPHASIAAGIITIGWDPVEGAASYNVYYQIEGALGATAAEGASPLLVTDATQLQITIPEGHTDKPVHIAVTAVNGTAESDLSEQVTVLPEE